MSLRFWIYAGMAIMAALAALLVILWVRPT